MSDTYIRGVVFRLSPNDIQESQLKQYCGATRFIHNHFLDRRIRRHKKGLKSSFYKDCLYLTKLKQKEGYEWLNTIPTVILQQSLRDLNTAYQNFFRRVKKGENPGFPKFKKKHHSRESFRITQSSNIRIKDGKLDIPMLKSTIKMIKHRNINFNNVKSYTVFEDCGQWYVSFTESFKPQQLEKTGSEIGLDVGIVRLATTSNSKCKKPFSNPILERKIKHCQRELSRRKKKSARWLKTKARLQKLHQHLRKGRKHYLHEYTTYLVENQDKIVIENLKVKSMMKSAKGTIENPGTNVSQKKGLNREIQKQSWGMLFSMLEYKCKWYGKEFEKVNSRNTSITCSDCGKKDRDSRLNQSKFVCTKCGFSINADQNAARNILKKAA